MNSRGINGQYRVSFLFEKMFKKRHVRTFHGFCTIICTIILIVIKFKTKNAGNPIERALYLPDFANQNCSSPICDLLIF